MINIQKEIKESAELTLEEILNRDSKFESIEELKDVLTEDYRLDGYFASLPSELSFKDQFDIAEMCVSEGMTYFEPIKDFYDIRNFISGSALLYLCLKAEETAFDFLNKLEAFISENELDMNQMATSDNYGWHVHDSEEDIIDGTIFKHRDVEGEFDIDLYKFHSNLFDLKVYFPKTPEKEIELMNGDYVIRDLVRIESNDLSYEVLIHFGREIGVFKEWEEAIESVKKDMKKYGYYPDVWHEKGRGILILEELEMDRD